MMKAVIIISLSLISFLGICQSPKEFLYEKAYNFLTAGQYDSSIYYCKQIQKKYTDFRKTTVLNILGDCYYKKGNLIVAERYFRTVVSLPLTKDGDNYAQYKSAKYFGDLFLNKMNYKLALNYYEKSHNAFSKLKHYMCGGRKNENNHFLTSKAACYFGLSRYDSVMKFLHPFMFQEYQCTLYPDSTEADSLSKVYAVAVIKIFGKEVAKRKLQNAIDNLYYEVKDSKSNNDLYEVNCSFNFLWNISYLKRELINKNEFPLAIKYYGKECIIQEVKSSAAYRYIMLDDCENEEFQKF